MANYFKKSMKMVLNTETGSAQLGEEDADKQLLIATTASMSEKLAAGRENGRYGWWRDDVCSLDDLYKMREKALKDSDHVSVLNFTAMIAMRESI